MGEPWLTAFDPLLLAQELRRMGFRHVEHFGPAEATRRYLRDRSDGLSFGTIGHLMKARV